MALDYYYNNACLNCIGFEECQPRNEENMKDCKHRNQSSEAPIKKKCNMKKTKINYPLPRTN